MQINEKYQDKTFFICIGGMKCGTTSLWRILKHHPQILGGKEKEPNFFGDIELFNKGFNSYLENWNLDEKPKAKYLFEASTHYSKFPTVQNVPERISKLPYNKKIIYMLRNPITRIESHLAHNISRGELDFKVFETGEWKNKKHFFNLSKYYMQLEEYLKFFEKKDIILLSFEEMIKDYENFKIKLKKQLKLGDFYNLKPLDHANPRRLENNADKVKFSNSDKEYVKGILFDDLEKLKDKFNFNTEIWG